jgi:uncharacterized protein
MRILHATDFHFRKHWYAWLREEARNYDAVCYSGDFLGMFQIDSVSLAKQAEWVIGWLRDFPKPFFACTGNHDVWPDKSLGKFLSQGGWIELARRPGIHIDEKVGFGGLIFSGQPWDAYPDLVTDWPIILIDHCPPAGAAVGAEDDGDIGAEITRRMENLPTGTFILCGHIHDPRSWIARLGNSWCFNPGVDDDAAIPNHIVLDTKARTAVFRGFGQKSAPIYLY